jgi:flagellar hook assembly protein FlgD
LRNRPNPFNPSTAISFKLQAASKVSLKIYDTAGRLVTTLVDGWREAGTHEVTFDGSKLASGIYLAKLTAGDFSQVQKLVLTK